MASLRKYFRKSGRETKVKKRSRRSVYNCLCGGTVEEERDTGEEPITKGEKQKADIMGVAESKSIRVGSSKIKAEIMEAQGGTNDEKIKVEKTDNGVRNDQIDNSTQNGIEGTDIDKKTTEIKEVETVNGDDAVEADKNELGRSAQEMPDSTEKDSTLEDVHPETINKDNASGYDQVDANDEIQENGISRSSSDSDSESSSHHSGDESKTDKSGEKHNKKMKRKKNDDKKKEKSPDVPHTTEISPEKEHDDKQGNVKAKEGIAATDKKKSGKNPLVRIQSKILDALSHQNFDSYTPAICIDFLKSPNLKLLSSLNKRLKQNKKEWNEEFLELNGSDVLLDIVDALGNKRVTQLSDALLLLECVECIKTLMNSKMGLEYLVQHGDYLKKLVKGRRFFLYQF